MKLKLQIYGAIAIVAIMLAAPASARADAVGDWNAIAVQATITAGRPNPTINLDVAMVQAAVYDAVQAIEKQYEPYYVEIPGASGSPVAATAKAAYDVLLNRFPAQAASLDMTYQQFLANNGLSENDPGVTVGAKAAAGIIALRACDGSFPNPAPPFIGGTDPGVWRPTLPAFAPMIAPWMGNVTPFTLTRPSQFRAQPPPALTSREYARDYNEVKTLGALNNSSRTAEQTDMAHFRWQHSSALEQGSQGHAAEHVNIVTVLGSLPWLPCRWPTHKSLPGTLRTTTFSGGRSPPSNWGTPTVTSAQSPTPPGCR